MAKRKDLVPAKTNLPAREALKAKIVAAKTTGEVRPVITAAKALKAGAKDAKNRQAIADATEIVRRAERKLGQLMAAQKMEFGVNKGGAGEHKKRNRDSGIPVGRPMTLAEAGIDKSLAYRAREAAEYDDETFEDDLKWDLDEILNPPKTREQREDEEEEREAYEATPEGQAELRRREEERERENEEFERRDRIENPQLYESPKSEIVPPERCTQSDAPEIISPTFTAKGAVNQTRFTEAMRSIKQALRLAYALSNRATFFKHVRDMLDDLENKTLPPKSVEQSVEERRAVNARLAEVAPAK